MEKEINVVIDISGSMFSDGKSNVQIYLLKTILHTIKKEKYLNCTIFNFYLWNDDLCYIDCEEMNIIFENHELNAIVFKGSSNINKIVDLINDVGNNGKFLLLSDGCFDYKEIDEAIKNNHSVFITVAVGADADINTLSKISCLKNKCYKPENIITALYAICQCRYTSIDKKFNRTFL